MRCLENNGREDAEGIKKDLEEGEKKDRVSCSTRTVSLVSKQSGL